MANIPLQSIKFPDLPNIYDAPTMESIGKGIFPELIAGGLVDLDSYVEDSDPYLFAAMPQGAGKVLTDELVGAKVAWNQFADNSHAPTSRGGLTIGGNSLYYTVSGTADSAGVTATGWFRTSNISGKAGHKVLVAHVLISGSVSNGKDITISPTLNNGEVGLGKTKIFEIPTGLETSRYQSYWYVYPSTVCTDVVASVQFIDLTQMLGSTIADHIYSLEQGTAGAGVAFFTKYFFGNGYRPYDAGSLQGALVSGHKMTGVNQWDEEWEVLNPSTLNNAITSKNFCPCIPGATYYFSMPNHTGSVYWGALYFYDKDKTQISYTYCANTTITAPSNAYYFKLITNSSGYVYGNTYKNDICINISNADINGKYFPYEEHTYDIEPEDLNGILKLVDGELKADGDVRRANGGKTVRYGIVNLGTVNWQKTDEAGFWFLADSIGAPRTWDVNLVGDILSVFAPTISKSAFDSDHSLTGFVLGNTNYISYVNMEMAASMTASEFKSLMDGVQLMFVKGTPTEDTAEPFEEYQRCNPYGTQEYLLDDSQIVPIPAGHNTKYFEDPLANIMARLDALENA